MASPFDPLPPDKFDTWHAAHLLVRAGFGGTWQDAESLAALGLDKAVDTLVNFPTTPTPRPESATPSPLDDPATREKTRDLGELERMQRMALYRREENRKITDLKFWWLNRMLTSRFPLQEKLTLFWHGHFASGFDEKIERAFPLWQQNEMFRQNALAPFPDLLRKLIRDPAMLVWLDNAQSHKGRPNENFARELMELFSTGPGPYSEHDVKESARALTGNSVDRETWQFLFNENAHDTGEKMFLGHKGNLDGDAIVETICEHDACSDFMSRKLLAFFVQENPPADLVADGARLLRLEQLDLKAWMSTLLRSQIFYSDQARGAVVKSPVMLTIDALKSMRVPVPEKTVLVDALRLMGQDLFFPPDVNGWPGGTTWINSNMLLVRYNFANWLLNGVSPDQFKVFDKKATGSGLARRDFVEDQRVARPVDWSPRKQITDSGMDRKLTTGADIVDYFLCDFLPRRPLEPLRTQLLAFAETDASGGKRSFSLNDANFDERVRGLVHLIMSSPDFQLC